MANSGNEGETAVQCFGVRVSGLGLDPKGLGYRASNLKAYGKWNGQLGAGV